MVIEWHKVAAVHRLGVSYLHSRASRAPKQMAANKLEAIDMRKKSAANEVPYTESVPELGRRLLGLGRQSSYAAARRGEIPTIKIGGKLRGLTRVLEARLARDPQNNAS